jgi:uncharacterized protein involved in exopolysaccharide biosynthesis
LKSIASFRIPLFLFTGSAFLAYLFSYFAFTPLYESNCVFFPPNTHANIHLVSAGIRFGGDKEVGEQLEMIQSEAVQHSMIEEFNLIERFEIDTLSPFWLENLQKKYNSRIHFDRTINKSIVVSVQDRDAKLAATMANRLVELADQHKNSVVKENIRSAAHSAFESFMDMKAIVESMSDSLEVMRLAGESVWNYGEERKSSRFTHYELQYRSELDRYLNLKWHWEELNDLLQAEVPSSYVVSSAIPQGKPVFPKKGLIALIAGFLSALIYLLIRNLNLA